MTKPKPFKALEGHWFKFYGVDGNCFKLGPTVYEAIEDPSDGYRSCLETIQVRDKEDLIFPRRSFAVVRVESDPTLEGYRLVDVEDGHVWLRVGTSYADDYYPLFTFTYQVKPNVKAH